jgi:hypothetical protein
VSKADVLPLQRLAIVQPRFKTLAGRAGEGKQLPIPMLSLIVNLYAFYRVPVY